MANSDLPKREDIFIKTHVPIVPPPSIKVYAWLIAFSIGLLIIGFIAAPTTDWSGFCINLSTEIIGAIIILAVVDKKIRTQDLEKIRNSTLIVRSEALLYFLPTARNLSIYITNSSKEYNELSMDLYVERPYLDHRIRDNENSILILGPAGSGKTTEIQRYYLSLCESTISNLKRGKIPVLLKGPQIHSKIQFVDDTLRLHFNRFCPGSDRPFSERKIIKFLKKGRLVIFIDDLDGHNRSRLHDTISTLEAFQMKWPNNLIVASARNYGVKMKNLKFTIVNIPEFTTDEHVRFFNLYQQYRNP